MLLYGLDEKERIMISDMIQQYKLPDFQIITDDMCNMKIKDILRGLKFEILNSSLPKEKVVLFNNLNDKEVETAVKNMKAAIPEVIMAVVTPTSIDWSFRELIEHLIEERNWFKKQNGK